MNKSACCAILISAAASLLACVSNPSRDSAGAADSAGKSGSPLTWFYPLPNTDNYYSPRKGQPNLMLYKSGKNYWYKNDDGKVVWLYAQGDHFYSQLPGKTRVYCYQSGKNIYCQN